MYVALARSASPQWQVQKPKALWQVSMTGQNGVHLRCCEKGLHVLLCDAGRALKTYGCVVLTI
eukprot:1206696-Pleurochrysis_carterae.AAC.5